jgi:uncharacterized protein (TIGR03118 family)
VPAASAQRYQQHNIVSDGSVKADIIDAQLVNPWGLTASATSPWWVSDNGADVSTLYNISTGMKAPLVVAVPGAPTGTVFNNSTGFEVAPGVKSLFLFATEAGTIRGWNPAATGTNTFVLVDNGPFGAVYKGLAMAVTTKGAWLYATNFHAGTVDVYDSTWTQVKGGFRDRWLPKGYAPFGIQVIGDAVFVTYALREKDGDDDVPGPGHGFVDQFDLAGHFIRRVASRGVLNSPWGIAWAPDGFGRFSKHLLIGNFGDGRIHAFDFKRHGHFGRFDLDGRMKDASGRTLRIDGLWAIAFGNGAGAGPLTTLFFTAGPNDEANGLMGSLLPVPKKDHDKDDDDNGDHDSDK